MKTVMASPDKVKRKWYLVDAEGKVLGRLSTAVARILKGKHKPTFTPHVDGGDHVVVINAEKIRVTGTSKLDEKVYSRFSGYPGGLRQTSLRRTLETRPEFVLQHAIRGMLPKSRLGRNMLRRVRIYKGPEHPHQAQGPENLDLA